jgi:hypothetical protein
MTCRADNGGLFRFCKYTAQRSMNSGNHEAGRPAADRGGDGAERAEFPQHDQKIDDRRMSLASAAAAA